MNWIIRLGMWWESRRKLSYQEFEEFKKAQQIPTALAKEVALIKARIDRIELLVGLKREPVPTQVKDAPRIS